MRMFKQHAIGNGSAVLSWVSNLECNGTYPGVSPKPLDTKEIPLFFSEYMNYYINVIQKYPLSIFFSLFVRRKLTGVLKHCFLHTIGNSFNLRPRFGMAYHKKIRYSALKIPDVNA